MEIEDQVAAHYGRRDLAAAILSALEQAGTDLTRLRSRDLAAVDEFHVRGAEATAELTARLDIEAGHMVLDVGSGLGGPSRHIAETFGCNVVGVDLTAEYCRCATELAERVGLGARVRYQQGSALSLPFTDRQFDRVVTQHVAMNIRDKATLYAEVHRVLKPGGLFGIYDLLQGPGGDVHFPVPWALDPSTRYLVTPEQLRELLALAGFEITHWRETSDESRQWFVRLQQRLERQGPPPIGFHLLLGPRFAEMARNQVRNLVENRIVPTEVVCRRPG